MELKELEAIFNGYSYLIPALSRAVANLETFQYQFMTEQSYQKLIEESPDPYEAQHVYCFEILERAHIAAVTSMVRADRWLKGIADAFRNNNFFVFTSSFRGFLESSADSHYVLAAVPRTISDTAEQIYDCLHRIPRSEIYSFQALEDRLIHYSHGRYVGKNELTPESHKARHMRDYLTYLQEESDGPVHDFYSELCEVTHPAADSVWCMLTDLDESTIVLNKEFDRNAILALSKRNITSLDWLFGQCISPALMTLGLINLMNIKELQTSAIDHVNLSIVGRWNEISKKVSSTFAVR